MEASNSLEPTWIEFYNNFPEWLLWMIKQTTTFLINVFCWPFNNDKIVQKFKKHNQSAKHKNQLDKTLLESVETKLSSSFLLAGVKNVSGL